MDSNKSSNKNEVTSSFDQQQTQVNEQSATRREFQTGSNTGETMKDVSENRRKPQLFHSVSIIVEPVLDDDSKSKTLVLTPTEAVPGSEPTIVPAVSPQSPVLDFDDFIFESQRKKSQEEDEIVQTIMANARLRKEEFARLLEEHAQLVNEINRAETTLL